MAEHSAKTKQVALIGIGAVVVILIVIFGTAKLLGSAKTENPSTVAISTVAGTEKVTDVTPAYRQQVSEHNAEQLKKSERKNETVLPILLPSQSEPQPKAPEKNAVTQPAANNAADTRSGGTPEALAAKTEAIRGMVAGLLGRPQPSRTLVTAAADSSKSSPGQAALATANAIPASTPQAISIASAGETLFAVTNSYINTDEPDMVHLTITSGPLTGGIMSGTASRQNETVKVVVTTLFWDKKTFSLTGQVMDVATARGLLSGEVDRKLLQRYGLPFLTGGMTGLGAAISQGGTQITSTAVGMNSTTTPLSGRQIAGAALAGGMQGVSQQIQNNARNTDPMVFIPAGTPVGIFLLSDITQTSTGTTKAAAAYEAPTPVRSQSGGQGQQMMVVPVPQQTQTTGYPYTQTPLFPQAGQRANVGVYGQPPQ